MHRSNLLSTNWKKSNNQKQKYMAQEVSIIKSICRFEPRNLALGLLIACFVITFSYFTMANFDSFHFFVGEFIISVIRFYLEFPFHLVKFLSISYFLSSTGFGTEYHTIVFCFSFKLSVCYLCQ